MTKDEHANEPESESPPSRGRDEDWDDWEQEDDWEDKPGGGGTDTRLIAVVLVAAVAIIATILFTRNDTQKSGDSDKQEQTADGQGEGDEDGEDEGPLDWPWAIGGQGQNIDEDGFYIWSDLEGIHLRSKMAEPLTVVFTADDPVTVKEPGVGVEASSTESTDITFEFPADSDGESGPDLDVSGFVEEFTVEVLTPDGLLEIEQFNVGDSANADDNPMTFKRGA